MLGLTSSITEERCATLAQTLARISCASVVKNALKLQGIVHNGGRRCQLRSEETHKKFSEKERTLSRTGATKRCCLNTNMCGVTLGVSTTVKKKTTLHTGSDLQAACVERASSTLKSAPLKEHCLWTKSEIRILSRGRIPSRESHVRRMSMAQCGFSALFAPYVWHKEGRKATLRADATKKTCLGWK